MPRQARTHHPATYQPIAFAALGWPGSFAAAMQDALRRDILEHIAIHWPQKPMDNIVSISRIDLLACQAAARGDKLPGANPYPDHGAPGQLFIKCFAAALQRMALATQALAESVYTDD